MSNELFVSIEFLDDPSFFKKHFTCPDCGTEICTEVWNRETARRIGFSSILKNNTIPKMCPECGTAISKGERNAV